MASTIDATKPTAITALTSDVRAQFAAAVVDIEALQDGTGFDSTVTFPGDVILGDASPVLTLGTTSNTINAIVRAISNVGTSDSTINRLIARWNTTDVAEIRFVTGADTGNKDDGIIRFFTAPSGTLTQALELGSDQSATFAGYVILDITDTDGTVEGSIWYDASEDKLKFKTAAGVETITSA